MAYKDLGKVAMTLGGEYNPSTVYSRLTVVVGEDGQSYVSIVDNVVSISPGVTAGWENYWQLLSKRGSGIRDIQKTGSSGLVDTYTIYYDNSTGTDTFNVTNGNGITTIAKTSTSGEDDTYTITFDDGTTTTFVVTNGKGIQSIAKTGTSGAVDTYTITYGNDQTSTFTVQNAVTATLYGTLTAAGWSGSAPYTQTINVTGIAASDSPITDISMNGVTSADTANAMLEAWSYVGRVETGAGTVTAYCYNDKPTVDLPIIMKVVN